MALDQRKYEKAHTDVLRDIRPLYQRISDWVRRPSNSFALFLFGVGSLFLFEFTIHIADIIFIVFTIYFLWLTVQDRSLAFKLPVGSKWKDKNNDGPGRDGKPEGILYLGNVSDTKEEVWFTNSDARTHILYLGTTGSGKTEGLKSLVSNALSWGSGFVYVDGKADTDLWSSLSSLVRRYGRDDDLLVLNYMTGNSDTKAPSNTMNPFSSGSASYLTNMLVSLMPEAEGDNAMWKERAVSLISSIMPALTWKRDHQDIPTSVSTIREYLTLPNVIKLSRDEIIPQEIRAGIIGYLDTLPGFIGDAYDDQGNPKPPGPDTPQYDTTTASQQHGYLSMQFTRALQSLGDEYGYIFDTQAADVDMVDVVLNRRILVTLIPALEKSADETANLGKIVAATIKGMMGSTLGANVEGESSTVIENKPTHSATPFMTVFDEVGYYTAQGMAVMAAQARSLGFCLVYSAQDLPALEKRVKEEARSITANCNIKIFGKLEDPTQTKEFFEKTVGSAIVIESSGFQMSGGGSGGSYYDNQQASMQIRPRASYDALRGFVEGQAIITFGEMVMDCRVFYSNPGHAKAMRVTRFMALPPPDENMMKNAGAITAVRDLMVHKTWTAMKADVAVETPEEIAALAQSYETAQAAEHVGVECGMVAIAGVYALNNDVNADASVKGGASSSGGPAPAKTVQKPNFANMKPKNPTSVMPPKPPPTSAQKPLPAVPETKAPPTAPITPPPTEVPPQTQQAPQAQVPTAPPQDAPADPPQSSSPMGFFAAKKPAENGEGASGSDAPPSPAAPPDGSVKMPQKPDDMKQAVDTSKETSPSGDMAARLAQSGQPEGTAPKGLDEETQKILKEAGEKNRKSLSESKDGSDDEGAADATK
jgi:intracellular multiplication protein IcmO